MKKSFNYLLFVVFTLFAILQLNDPDPIIWFTIYAAVSIIALLANFKTIPRNKNQKSYSFAKATFRIYSKLKSLFAI